LIKKKGTQEPDDIAEKVRKNLESQKKEIKS